MTGEDGGGSVAAVAIRMSKSAVHPPLEALLKRVWPPMLAKLSKETNIRADDFVFEVKYDGYRGLAAVSGGKLAFLTRNGLDLSSRFPTIAQALSSLKVAEAVIDGEVVGFDEHGISRFQLLMTPGSLLGFMAFDLLWLNGQDTRALPLEQRRNLLESVLAGVSKPIQLAEHLSGETSEVLAEIKRRGLEGMVAKRRGSQYVGARSADWLKLKVAQSQEVVIVGYLPISTGAKEIGALLIATAEKGGFRFAGKVGTGLTQSVRRELWRELEKGRLHQPSVVDPPREKGVVWVKPRLVAQVSFGEWTRDGRMRHPVFQGLREDKKPEEVVRERPEQPKQDSSARAGSVRRTDTARRGGTRPLIRGDVAATGRSSSEAKSPTVQLTHPDKLLFPESGITKRDVFEYYREMAPFLLPALAERPLAFEQWPQGIAKAGIFRQHARGVPPWATQATVQHARGTVQHLLVDRPETLLWLANQSALTLHIGAARILRIQEPDWVSFDLDPPEGKWSEVIELATALRRFLEQLGLESVPKTSGKKGLHVLVPIAPGYTHGDALEFAFAIAGTLARGLPAIVTTERSPARRKGRVYVDALQNMYGKTIVAPYSLRAVEGASASTPLHWSEVTRKLDPRQLNLRTLRKRLDKEGDLFAPALKNSQKLPQLHPAKKQSEG